MMKKNLINIMTAGFGALVIVPSLLNANTACPFEKGAPNVLFIVVDDLRTSLETYGDPLAVTPNLTKLAARSIQFDRAYAQQAICGPSRVSALTGKRPDNIRVWDNGAYFRDRNPGAVTLPQYFKQKGYETVSMGKIFSGRPQENMQDPDSWTEEPRFWYHPFRDMYANPQNVDQSQPKPGTLGNKGTGYECEQVGDDAYVDGQMTDAAIEYLSTRDSNKPFFLAVGYRKPHLPFNAPSRYWELYNPEVFQNWTPGYLPDDTPRIASHGSPEPRGYRDMPAYPFSLNSLSVYRHGYYACVSFIDEQIGRIIRSLEDEGLGRNTIIVVWGDHGFHVGEKGLFGKTTNFELDTRAPLILSIPGKTDIGIRTKAVVELVDIFPTLVDACGLPAIAGLDGESLAPLVTKPGLRLKDFAISQISVRREGKAFLHPAIVADIPPEIIGYSIRDDQYRYTEWRETGTGVVLGEELYDYTAQSTEISNLAGKGIMEKTRNQLRNKLHSVVSKQ